MKSMLVVGLGRFGSNLATELSEYGNEVVAIDRDEKAVAKIMHAVTKAKIGDCMERDTLEALGVNNFDICFVCMSEDFQSSLEITSLLKELGANYVVSKADREIHEEFLRKIGADDVICPERDMAHRAAVKYSSNNLFDYIEFTPEYLICEIKVPDRWEGRTLRQLNIRHKDKVNVIAVKNDSGMFPSTEWENEFRKDDHVLVVGRKSDIIKMLK